MRWDVKAEKLRWRAKSRSVEVMQLEKCWSLDHVAAEAWADQVTLRQHRGFNHGRALAIS